MEGEAVREFLARNALGGHVAKIVDELCYGNDGQNTFSYFLYRPGANT